MLSEHVSYSAARYAEERGARKAIEESCDQHGLDISGDSTRDEPNEEEREGANVDWSSTKELHPVSKC